MGARAPLGAPLVNQPLTAVVMPAYNEGVNLGEVVPELAVVLAGLEGPSLIFVVNDGSTDDTRSVLTALAATQPTLQAVHVPGRSGKALALRAGFTSALDAGAARIVMMDADGQDHPSEIPRLLAALDEGADLATGARNKRRQDRFIKRWSSVVYNSVTARVSGVRSRDMNSGLKAMTANVATDLLPSLYGDLHRYVSVVAHWRGYRLVDVPVIHRPRLHGTSKYGPRRYWRGLMDLVTIRFLVAYQHRPSHLVSTVGLLALLGGSVILSVLVVEWLLGNPIGDRPLLLAGVLLVVSGLQLVLFGLVAELIVAVGERIMHDRQRR